MPKLLSKELHLGNKLEEVDKEASKPELVIIDAVPKQSASKYKPNNCPIRIGRWLFKL